MAEGWLVARRTLSAMSVQARMWKVELPEEAAAVLSRTDAKFGLAESPFESPSPKSILQPTVSSQSYVMPPPISQFSQPQIDWQRTASAYASSLGMLNTSGPSDADPLQTLANSFSASASVNGQFNPSTQTSQYTTPQFPLSPALQDFSPRSNFSANRLSVKRTSSGQNVGQQRATMQTPSYLPQQPQSSALPQQQIQQQQTIPQQPRSMAQPTRRNPSITTTALQQQQAALRNNTKTSAPTPDVSSMFGGVEALLREGQEWWMKDQSHDLVSGFGNWNSTGGSVEGGTWLDQQQQQQQPQHKRQNQGQGQQGQQHQQQQARIQSQAQAQAQPQAQPRQHQQQLQQQSTMMQNTPSPQKRFLQQPQSTQQQLYAMQRSNSIQDESSVSSTPMYGMVNPTIPGLQQPGQGSGMYEFGNLESTYNEDEWYQ